MTAALIIALALTAVGAGLLSALLAVLGEAVGVHDDIHGRGW